MDALNELEEIVNEDKIKSVLKPLEEKVQGLKDDLKKVVKVVCALQATEEKRQRQELEAKLKKLNKKRRQLKAKIKKLKK